MMPNVPCRSWSGRVMRTDATPFADSPMGCPNCCADRADAADMPAKPPSSLTTPRKPRCHMRKMNRLTAVPFLRGVRIRIVPTDILRIRFLTVVGAAFPQAALVAPHPSSKIPVAALPPVFRPLTPPVAGRERSTLKIDQPTFDAASLTNRAIRTRNFVARFAPPRTVLRTGDRTGLIHGACKTCIASPVHPPTTIAAEPIGLIHFGRPLRLSPT